MTSQTRFAGVALTGLAALVLGLPLLAQDPSAPALAAGQARLGGIWTLNKDLSSDTSGVARTQPQDDGRGSGGGSGGASGGGGGYGGRGGGARTGGGRGSRGSGGGAGADPEQMLQRDALTREVAEPPERLTIVVSDAAVEFTDDQGVVRKFTTNGKKEKIDLGTAKVDSVSKWDADVLTIELTGGYSKLTETYQVTIQGHVLVEALKMQFGADAPTGTVPKRIFDKAE